MDSHLARSIRFLAGLFLCAWGTLACAVEAAPPGTDQDQTVVLQELISAEVPQLIEGAALPDAALAGRPRRALPALDALSSTVAELGKPAPDFALTDDGGRTVKLADFRGKTVVLEWFDPDCAYVRRSHERGSLKGAGNAAMRAGVVWLAINSVPRDRGGSSLARNLEARLEWSLAYPVLFDESGEVARAWRVSTTPHLFVVDPEGVLVYEGAIDNAQEPGRNRPTNYVELALAELGSGKISRPRTNPYGCRLP